MSSKEFSCHLLKSAFVDLSMACASSLAASYDGGVFPVMHDFLYHLQIKNYQKRRFGIVENGSWAPSAGHVMKEMIEAMKDCTIVEPLVTIRSRMKPADEEHLTKLAEAMLS